jgi:hypothetical protein
MPLGKVVMESILETKATTILEFIAGLRGSLWVSFEDFVTVTLEHAGWGQSKRVRGKER